MPGATRSLFLAPLSRRIQGNRCGYRDSGRNRGGAMNSIKNHQRDNRTAGVLGRCRLRYRTRRALMFTVVGCVATAVLAACSGSKASASDRADEICSSADIGEVEGWTTSMGWTNTRSDAASDLLRARSSYGNSRLVHTLDQVRTWGQRCCRRESAPGDQPEQLAALRLGLEWAAPSAIRTHLTRTRVQLGSETGSR